MNNYCKRCRLRDGCLRKCKEAEVYEQGYCDGVSDGYKGAVDALTPDEQQPKLIIKIEGLKKIKMEKETKTAEVQEYLKNIRTNIPNLKDYKTIKTYDDACTALGEKVDEVTLTNAGVPKHIIALMKLELVCKALWGGEVNVYPDPKGNRKYYVPCFALYAKNEMECMDSKERSLLLSAFSDVGACAGWGCIGAVCKSSDSNVGSGFRLGLDTYQKARYFGTQFLGLWTEYLAYNFKVGEYLK